MIDAVEKFIKKNINRADEYKEIIEGMLADYDAYHYAEATLLGILDYIEANDVITPKQIEAVENIKNSPSEYHGN